MYSCIRTEHCFEAVQSRRLRQDERRDRQVHEPDEKARAEVQVELRGALRDVSTQAVAQFEEEPEHDCEAEDEDDEAGSRLPLVRVADDVDLHLRHTENIPTNSIALQETSDRPGSR